MPTPYGLVRAGVAPDHQKIKSVTAAFDKVAAHPRFRFFGGVELGTDLTVEDLRRHYHQLLYATGAQTDRRMGIPGEDLTGSHPATEFVAWYNGHPDYAHYQFDLSAERVAVVGVGNVAIDVARILCLSFAELVVTEMGHRPKRVAEGDVETGLAEADDAPEARLPRPPVVTIMGHVDHGKTSLLDAIRKANVAAGEAGGITQHIGAYKVETGKGPVVFLDTPGHEAFTAMRARGATVTDVAVIVVAADDGVMPQTEEAINHAKAANVKIMVALNKIDKPQANPNKVKGQLASLGLQTEDWGGTTTSVEVSAITGQGVDQLVEMLSLEADLLDLGSVIAVLRAVEPDTIFHLAAHGAYSWETDPARITRTNVAGTKNLLEAALAAGRRHRIAEELRERLLDVADLDAVLRAFFERLFHVPDSPLEGSEAMETNLAAEGVDVRNAQEVLEQTLSTDPLDDVLPAAWAVGLH